MKIRLEEAVKIAEKYSHDEAPLTFLHDMQLTSKTSSLRIQQGMRFDPSQYELFMNANVRELDIIYNEHLYAKLAVNFPSVYRMPIGRKNVIDLDRAIESLESPNGLSKRKRCIISLSEFYKKSATGFSTTLFYGERLDFTRWNQVKVDLNRNAVIDYRYDEGGIIVFFLMNSNDPQYAQKFMRFTDLVSILVESRSAGFAIAPDFNPETDVYTVNEKGKLLETYSNSRATLVVVGEDLNEEYKQALTQLRSFDNFAKLMVIKNINTMQKADILNQVKTIYNQKPWEK